MIRIKIKRLCNDVFGFVAGKVFVSEIQAQVFAAGEGHSLSICDDARIKAWGRNNRGQLGDGDHEDAVFVPYRVGALKNVISIGAGFGHSVAITQDGSIYVWGRGMSDIRTDSKC